MERALTVGISAVVVGVVTVVGYYFYRRSQSPITDKEPSTSDGSKSLIVKPGGSSSTQKLAVIKEQSKTKDPDVYLRSSPPTTDEEPCNSDDARVEPEGSSSTQKLPVVKEESKTKGPDFYIRSLPHITDEEPSTSDDAKSSIVEPEDSSSTQKLPVKEESKTKDPDFHIHSPSPTTDEEPSTSDDSRSSRVEPEDSSSTQKLPVKEESKTKDPDFHIHSPSPTTDEEPSTSDDSRSSRVEPEDSSSTQKLPIIKEKNSTGVDEECSSAIELDQNDAETLHIRTKVYEELEQRPSAESDDLPSKRRRTAMEILQTETSYLGNLNTIIKVYKEPLEKAVAEGNPLIAIEDIKTIFGGIQEIANVHSDVHHDVSEIIDNWEEDCCLADVIKKYEKQLLEVYPRYVNYFDMGQSLLLKRQESNPDFYAFLVECFNEPQNHRQNLEALLLRPVQRLPSLLLLTSDLQKRTPSDLQDYNKLEEAKAALRQVLLHINEDKRKTEAKTKIFDIVYEVTGCPPLLVSSNRSFVKKVDVTTLTDGFYREGERLALYLLNDALEIAKWRNRSHGTSLLKHIELLSLHNITSVMDLNSEDNIFAVRYRSGGSSSVGSGDANGYTEERVSILQLLDDKKQSWLEILAKQVAEVKNLPNEDDILKEVGPSDLLNFTRKNTKLYKRLKSKCKGD